MKMSEAAERLDVHYQTAYRWVREGVLPARKVGGSYELDAADVDAFAARRATPAPARRRLAVRDWEAQAERFHGLLVEGEEREARALVARLHDGGVPVIDVCERVLAPALRRIGEEWADGEVSVAEEHRAAAICERILAPLAVPGPGRPRGVCVVATTPGETHRLPGLMATAVLREAHWRVHHLATEVPLESLRALVRSVGANLAVFSVAYADAEAPARRMARMLAHDGVAVLVGTAGTSLRELLDRSEEATRGAT